MSAGAGGDGLASDARSLLARRARAVRVVAGWKIALAAPLRSCPCCSSPASSSPPTSSAVGGAGSALHGGRQGRRRNPRRLRALAGQGGDAVSARSARLRDRRRDPQGRVGLRPLAAARGRARGPTRPAPPAPASSSSRTWATYGVDANGDGLKDIYSVPDSVFATANYLHASGAPGDWRRRSSPTTTPSGTSKRCCEIARGFGGANSVCEARQPASLGALPRRSAGANRATSPAGSKRAASTTAGAAATPRSPAPRPAATAGAPRGTRSSERREGPRLLRRGALAARPLRLPRPGRLCARTSSAPPTPPGRAER